MQHFIHYVAFLIFLCDRKFLSHKTLREDAHLAEMKYMLRIPLERERVASDSFFIPFSNLGTALKRYVASGKFPLVSGKKV